MFVLLNVFGGWKCWKLECIVVFAKRGELADEFRKFFVGEWIVCFVLINLIYLVIVIICVVVIVFSVFVFIFYV